MSSRSSRPASRSTLQQMARLHININGWSVCSAIVCKFGEIKANFFCLLLLGNLTVVGRMEFAVHGRASCFDEQVFYIQFEICSKEADSSWKCTGRRAIVPLGAVLYPLDYIRVNGGVRVFAPSRFVF